MEAHSKDRLESFSDGVFAFAATLLVVSFEVPDNFDTLKDLLIQFVSFGLSFLALVLIWIVHYNYYRKINRIDYVIIAINMLLLFVILFYIYPMKFIANMITGKSSVSSADELSLLFTIYGFGFALIFSCIAFLYNYSAKLEPELSTYLKFYRTHFLLYVVVGIVSIGLAQLHVGLQYGVPGFVFALLGPLAALHSKKFTSH